MKRTGLTRPAVVFVFTLVIAVALMAIFVSGEPPLAGNDGGLGSSIVAAGPIITYSADAYSTEVQALLNGFSATSGVRVAPVRSGGSFADAALIAAGAPDDVFVSVALSATSSRFLGNASSGWALGFAADQMVIAYSNSSASQQASSRVIALASKAESTNATADWAAFFSSLTSGQVRVGISSPVSDPAGLRGWLVLEAAGHIYSGGDSTAYVDRMVQTRSNVTGASAATLAAPLQAGQIQFLFTYKSAALGLGLGYVRLDRHVDMGDPSLSAYYTSFTYTDAAGSSSGAPIVLSITVPSTSANSVAALKFVEYVVENAGELSSFGLQPMIPARLYSNVALPPPIAGLVSQGSAVDVGRLG